MKSGIKIKGFVKVECFDKDGKLKWHEENHNLIVNEGLIYIGANGLEGTHYVGLTGSSPSPAAGDTMLSHAGWTEFSDYTGNRKEWVEVRSSYTWTNTASPASFAITGTGTVGGAFINTDASGTAGTLLAVMAFTGNRTVANGDTVNVTYAITLADDGV